MVTLVSPRLPGGNAFSVMAYGAKADGTTDDTAAFNACFTAAGSFASSNGRATVLVPPGKYRVDGPATVKGNVTYDFRGAFLLNGNAFTSANWHMFNYTAASSYAGDSNVTVLGGTFDAQGQNATVDTTSAVRYAKNIFLIGDGRNYRFEKCTFRNIPSFHALDVNGIDGLVVENCRFEGYTDNNTPSMRNQSEAIQIENGTGGNPTKNVRIVNNYCGPAIDGSGLGGFGKLIGSHTDTNGTYYSNIVVQGNTVVSPLENGIGFYSITDSVISNNIVTDAGRDGIRLSAGNTSSTNQNFNVVIADNVIRNAALAGISLEATRRSVVRGNFIYAPGLGGIDLSAPYNNYPTANGTNTQPSPDNTISDNTIIGASRTTNAAFGGVDLTGANNTKNYITGNKFRKYGSGNEALTPIRIQGTGAGNTYIVDNTFGADWSSDYLSNITTSNAVWWDGGKSRYVRLASAFNLTINSTSFQDVTGMSFYADSNCIYEIEAVIAMKSFTQSGGTGTPDCKTAWTLPSGATGVKMAFGSTNSSGNYTSREITATKLLADAWGNTAGYQVEVANSTQFAVERGLIVMSSTSGTVQLQAAAFTLSTHQSAIDTGSYIKIRKLDI